MKMVKQLEPFAHPPDSPDLAPSNYNHSLTAKHGLVDEIEATRKVLMLRMGILVKVSVRKV